MLKQLLALFQSYFNFEGRSCADWTENKGRYCWSKKKTQHKTQYANRIKRHLILNSCILLQIHFLDLHCIFTSET